MDEREPTTLSDDEIRVERVSPTAVLDDDTDDADSTDTDSDDTDADDQDADADDS